MQGTGSAGVSTIIFKGGKAGREKKLFSISALHCIEARSNASSVSLKISESKLSGKPHCSPKPIAM